MSESPSFQRHPLGQLAILILLMLGGSLVFGVLGMALAAAFYGFDAMSTLPFLRILQTFLAAGTFVIPGWYFARLSGEKESAYLHLNRRPYPVLLLLTLLIMLSSSAPLDLLVDWNKQMKLPGFLQGLENWMKAKEQETYELLKQLTVMNSPADLLFNLLMLAVLPAFGEEIIFRGIVQKIGTRWTGNAHAGIWIAAIIFSAIHLQFYGFLPRMLLGALFGYLLLWSGNLWLPILGHFINNAAVVLLTYDQQRRGLPFETLEQTPNLPGFVYFSNTAILAVGLFLFYRYTKARSADTQ